MSADPSIEYEQLTPEEAAHVDAVCDRFERAWKETKSGAPEPNLANYLDHSADSTRATLRRELVALDHAYRERYGPAVVAATRILHRQTAAPAGSANWPHIPGLELVEFLGSGGMGVVFKARQATLDRDVAVKLLRDDHRADQAQRERFLQEARAVARLRHPNLVQVYDCGEVPAADGATPQPYLVLEFVSGGSLANLLQGTPQPPLEAARLVETLAEAIHYAHQQGVIHRDLKPANVLLQIADCRLQIEKKSAICNLQSAIPKVTDFGLAKFLTGNDLTLNGDVLGTPSYMAPEQAAGQSEFITAAVDVYGLGAILYECLTGRPPFAAATVDVTLAQVRQDDPVPPRRLQPTVPRDLETICLKCLRKEPGRRYAGARDLADDLRRFRAGEPIRARPVGTAERVVGWCRRKPAIAGLLATLLLVVLAGLSGVVWQWQQANRNAAEAEQNAAAYLRERDIARHQKDRAEHHLQMSRERVDRLNRLGHDLLKRRGQYRTGQAVLMEALALYQEMVPEDGNDPRVRRVAADLFGQVGALYFTIGQWSEAADAYGRQVSLLTDLLKEEPTDQKFRLHLGDSYRRLGNCLRPLGKLTEARAAYDRATEIHEALLRDFPDEPLYHSAVANTLLNMAPLLSPQEHAGELGPLYCRVVQLDRDAVRAVPDDSTANSELALALGDQGMFFLVTGRGAEAEVAIREALAIDQRLLDRGQMKDYIERYLGRNLLYLGQILAASGQAEEAEKSYRRAVDILDPFLEELPESAIRRVDLALAQAQLADHLKAAGRRQEAEALRRRVVGHYERLKADFPQEYRYRSCLVWNYLELANLLYQLNRPADATDPYHKALELECDDPQVCNTLAWCLATAPAPALRDGARAVRSAKKAVAARPRCGDFHNTLGVAYIRNGEYQAAVTELETGMGLRAGGDSCDWFFLAIVHAHLGDRDKARMWFDRAVQWQESHKPRDDDLRRFRAEAEAALTEVNKR